jgi:hypothetical protein
VEAWPCPQLNLQPQELDKDTGKQLVSGRTLTEDTQTTALKLSLVQILLDSKEPHCSRELTLQGFS